MGASQVDIPDARGPALLTVRATHSAAVTRCLLTFCVRRFGNVCAIFIVGCIFVSIIAIVIETLPSLRKNNSAGKFFIAVVQQPPPHCQLLWV